MSIMHANNESVSCPIREVEQFAVAGVCSARISSVCWKIPFDVEEMNIDLAAIGHT